MLSEKKTFLSKVVWTLKDQIPNFKGEGLEFVFEGGLVSVMLYFSSEGLLNVS